MSDSGGFKAVAEEMVEAAGEVATEAKDAGLEMLEQGAQAVTAPPITAQQVQQQKQQDQADLAEARRKIRFIHETQNSQLKVQQENQQKENQRIQDQQKQPPQEGASLQGGVVPKPGEPKVAESEEIARTRQESGKGHGVGG